MWCGVGAGGAGGSGQVGAGGRGGRGEGQRRIAQLHGTVKPPLSVAHAGLGGGPALGLQGDARAGTWLPAWWQQCVSAPSGARPTSPAALPTHAPPKGSNHPRPNPRPEPARASPVQPSVYGGVESPHPPTHPLPTPTPTRPSPPLTCHQEAREGHEHQQHLQGSGLRRGGSSGLAVPRAAASAGTVPSAGCSRAARRAALHRPDARSAGPQGARDRASEGGAGTHKGEQDDGVGGARGAQRAQQAQRLRRQLHTSE